MIAASDPQEFVPSGRQQLERHPGAPENPSDDLENKIYRLNKLNVPLIDEFEKVSLKENQSKNEWWTLRKYEECSNTEVDELLNHTWIEEPSQNKLFSTSKIQSPIDRLKGQSSFGNDHPSPKSSTKEIERRFKVSKFETKSFTGSLEEELYVKGDTVVWTRGVICTFDDSCSTKKTVACYKSRSPVLCALWCNFYLERPIFQSLVNVSCEPSKPTITKVPSLCIIDDQNVKAYTEQGENFDISLPFRTSKVWSTAYGVLIERCLLDECKDSTLGPKSCLYSLAYPLDDICPVIVKQGSNLGFLNNTAWKVVSTHEKPSICVMFNEDNKQHSAYVIRRCKMEENDFFDRSIGHCSSAANSSSKLRSRYAVWENPHMPPVPSHFIMSHNMSIHQQSLKPHSSMASISRGHSTLSSTGSVHTSRLDANMSFGKSYLQHDSSKSLLTSSQFPLICFEHFWTESWDVSQNGPATKVFISKDLVGQSYFCYIVSSKLHVAKADFSNETCFNLGSSNSISARDAVPIPNLHMMAILEYNGNVTLYSGMTLIGKLHLEGTLVKHTPTPSARRIQKLKSPFPKRSSLLPDSKEVHPEFDEHLFSPVLASDSTQQSNMFNRATPSNAVIKLIKLRDGIENRLTLQYSDDTFYRVKLPRIATSPLVESCLTVLRRCLEREAVITFLSRWYSTRNSLGSQNVTDDQEWDMFTALLVELLGYEEEQLSETSKEELKSPFVVRKKLKHSQLGSDDDWEYLCKSKSKIVLNSLDDLLGLQKASLPLTESSENVQINVNSVLFPHIKVIHFYLHLLYEDFKLDSLQYDLLKQLAKFLCKLSNDLYLPNYSVHYWKDFPEDCVVASSCKIPKDLKNVHNINFDGVADIMLHLNDLIDGINVNNFPYVQDVNERSKDLALLCEFVSGALRKEITSDGKMKSLEEAVLLMTQMNVTRKMLDTLPFGLYLFFYNALWKCRDDPPGNWPSEAYLLIQREDLVAHAEKTLKDKNDPLIDKFDIANSTKLSNINDPENTDGMEDVETSVTKLRFPDDVRVSEAKNMLQSSKPVPIVLVQRPDISDEGFIEEQEKHLYAICTRTMALPVGRGMFTYRTSTPLITKPLQSPQLCLTGKVAPRGTTVELTHIDTPANMNLWPLFHNGVANGLRIAPDSASIDNAWIVFNWPKSADTQMEHGGFLLAMGLHGRLKTLDDCNRFSYLSTGKDMISIGLIIGLASSFRATSNLQVTKILSIHLEALLPPTSMELEQSQQLQVAALLGLGLVYQGTRHAYITEVLLSEIGRPPGPEMENCFDRESYSLAAGLALGLVALQKGGNAAVGDLNVTDTLYYYMIGGLKRPYKGAQKDKYKVPSFQIREGNSVNLDLTAPASTLALGLMYLGTNNRTIANWMSPPETQYLLDFVRPDFLMLRVLSKSLILWDDIDPSKEWVEGQVPENIRRHCMVQPSSMEIDYEAMNQAYCNIVAGACFAVALKYAGSADEDAFEILLHYCRMFISLTGKSISELAGKPTIETCLNVLLLSVSIVMAGTGNLEVVRLVRHLRKRVGVASSAVVTYGSHLAIHMALGLLFLGGGRYTLSNSPTSVAALICAFYPKFPTHSNDNRYHLQAFRHLYVLATETRLIIPKDVRLGKSCYVNLRIVKVDGATLELKAPAMLPKLDTITEILVNDERYWNSVFRRNKNWELLEKILSTNGFLEVKQKAGCLSYTDDQSGYHSQFARTLTQSKYSPWNPPASAIVNFTSDQTVKYFCNNFLSVGNGKEREERNLKKLLTKLTYDAVVLDKTVVVTAFAAIRKMIANLPTSPSTIQLRQFKLTLSQMQNAGCDILSSEAVLAAKQEIINEMESWEPDLMVHVENFLNGNIRYLDNQFLTKLSAYVTFFDVPFNSVSKVDLLQQLCRRNSADARKVLKLLAT